MIKYTLTLADGQVITITRKASRPLRFWKSDLMHRAPYGTDFGGATWKRVRT